MEIDLYGTLEQLKTEFVMTVLNRLTANGSKVLPEWNNVLSKTEERFKLAKENSDYLGTIKDYLEVCGKILFSVQSSLHLSLFIFCRKYATMIALKCRCCRYPMSWSDCVTFGQCPATIVAIRKCRYYFARYPMFSCRKSRRLSTLTTFFGN